MSEETNNKSIFSLNSFEGLGLTPNLAQHLENPDDQGGLGLMTRTSVQSLTIPAVLQDRSNLLVKSQTGSGKTLAYLIPIINEFMNMIPAIKREDGTRALIIAPTRELCTQIADVLTKLTRCCIRIVGGSITGGEKRKSEKARLRKGITILVGTPGRLLDHLKFTESFDLTNLRWIVLDEIDRLLDMGFEQTVLEILSRIRGIRLPGLKDTVSITNTYKSNAVKAGNATNLKQKWVEQQAVLVKKCAHPEDLRYMFVSATLTDSVKRLSWPILGASSPSINAIGFKIVDGDTSLTTRIAKETDLQTLHQLKPEHSLGDSLDDNSHPLTTTESTSLPSEHLKIKANLGKGETVDTPSRLSQYYMTVNSKNRMSALLSFLYLHRHQKVVVFFSTCDAVDFHALLFARMQWPLALDSEGGYDESKGVKKVKMERYLDPIEWKFSGVFGEQTPMFRLHGKVPQATRKLVYNEFCKLKQGILLCTDVAARGLDLPQVDWILQYDAPCETTDYVHRIGRTARKGLEGSAMLFLLPSESMYTNLLSTHGLLPTAVQASSMFMDVSQYIPGAKKFKNIDEMAGVILQRRVENILGNHSILHSTAVQAYRSYIRAYATHSSDTKGIFKVQFLHLGHVAKSFGLKEKPKDLQPGQKNEDGGLHNMGDVIGRIFNGEYIDPKKKVPSSSGLLKPTKPSTDSTEKTNFTSNTPKSAMDAISKPPTALATTSVTTNISKKLQQLLQDTEDYDDDEDEKVVVNVKEKNMKKEEKEVVAVAGKKRKSEIEAEETVVEEEEEVDEEAEEGNEEDVMDEEEAEEGQDKEEDKEEDSDEDESIDQETAIKLSKKIKKPKIHITAEMLNRRKLSFKMKGHDNNQRRSLSPSGKFRTGGSYFRKKLRSQSQSEFSAH